MITINYRDGRPFYEQVKEPLRRLILSGGLAPDHKLPSVRAMASELAINPNTIQRAYRELEAEGYIYSVPGKGSFISPKNKEDPRLREVLQQFDKLVEELELMGIEKEKLIERMRGGGSK